MSGPHISTCSVLHLTYNLFSLERYQGKLDMWCYLMSHWTMNCNIWTYMFAFGTVERCGRGMWLWVFLVMQLHVMLLTKWFLFLMGLEWNILFSCQWTVLMSIWKFLTCYRKKFSVMWTNLCTLLDHVDYTLCIMHSGMGSKQVAGTLNMLCLTCTGFSKTDWSLHKNDIKVDIGLVAETSIRQLRGTSKIIDRKVLDIRMETKVFLTTLLANS